MNGLYDAKCDGQPVLAITGHTFHDLTGTHYQQDVDLVKVFSDVAAYNERVMGPAHVCNVVDEAMKPRSRSARRAHYHSKRYSGLDVPTVNARKPILRSHSGDLYSEALPLPSQATLERAADILNGGTKIAILAGRGCLPARKEILELAEKLGAPSSSRCLERRSCRTIIPTRPEASGLLGTAPSQEVLEDCDTLLIAGSSFPYLEFYPKPGQARAVQIDFDSSRIGFRYPVDVGLTGQCWDVLRALLPLIEPRTIAPFC